MNQVSKLESLLARVQERRNQPRPVRGTRTSEEAAKTASTNEAPTPRGRIATPLELAAAKSASGFAPRPALKQPAKATTAAPKPTAPAAKAAPSPAAPAASRPSSRPTFAKPATEAKTRPIRTVSEPAAPAPQTAAPAAAPTATPITARKSAPPSAAIAKVVGEAPASVPSTFGGLVELALSLRPR